MREEKYIANLHELQTLVQEEFSGARKATTTHEIASPESITAIISALQSEDIFNQRLQHLIEGFKRSKELFALDKKFRHAFLDLQYFQLVTIERDLGKIFSVIPSLAGAHHPALFPRYNQLRQLIRTLKNTARRSLIQRILSGLTPLNSAQAAACLSLYTMTSERIVLHWFRTAMPFGKPHDLLLAYQSELDSENDSIELF